MSTPALQCPGVRFEAGFLRRLERLAVRLVAARNRREGGGSAALAGGGDEFVGYRPYRPGEDLRRLDWNLYARLDAPYVRVTRREASERWALLLDSSASMGVGPPGKLQAAAEIACGLACVGLRQGAEVLVASEPASDGASVGVARRATDLPGLIGFLESRRARGDAGLARLCRERAFPADCGRVFMIGDLLDVEPSDVLGLRRPGRELFVVQVLAPLELAPPAGAIEWHDPEGAGHVMVEVDGASRAAYERALELRLEAWDELAARHGIRFRVASSAEAFEDVVRGVLGA
ncbi:MAG: DUF58 domain-containing protein [bacterium]|nr:DUF58 domain-containing protein [bacterium]